jgi:hypothetical protein
MIAVGMPVDIRDIAVSRAGVGEDEHGRRRRAADVIDRAHTDVRGGGRSP